MYLKPVEALNDQFRTTFDVNLGEVVIVGDLAKEPPELVHLVKEAVKAFDEFNENNDPYLEHDFGCFELAGSSYIWKIDYYNHSRSGYSPDPSDPVKTHRVLSILYAYDY